MIGNDSLPVSFATVSIQGGPFRIANGDGEVSLARVGAMTLNVEARRIGYVAWRGVVQVPDSASVITIRLTRLGTKLGTVTVTEPAPINNLHLREFYLRALMRQKGIGDGVFFSPEEIEKRNPMMLTQLLEGVSGITFRGAARVPFSARYQCQMSLVIDGALIQLQPPHGSHSDWDELVHGGSILSVEVYTHGAQMPDDIPVSTSARLCGAVVVTTGSRR